MQTGSEQARMTVCVLVSRAKNSRGGERSEVQEGALKGWGR